MKQKKDNDVSVQDRKPQFKNTMRKKRIFCVCIMPVHVINKRLGSRFPKK